MNLSTILVSVALGTAATASNLLDGNATAYSASELQTENSSKTEEHLPQMQAGIPSPVEVTDFDELTKSSPFTRLVFPEREHVEAHEPIPTEPPPSLTLISAARIGTDYLVTLFDDASQEKLVLTQVPNDRGWKVVGLTQKPFDVESLSVEIDLGSDHLLTVNYSGTEYLPTKDTGEQTMVAHAGQRDKASWVDRKVKPSEWVRWIDMDSISMNSGKQ